MTLRQKVFLKKLPENNYNISKTMRESGYKPSTSVSGVQYKILQRLTNKIDYFNPDIIKKDIISIYRMAKKSKDITNAARINEHRSKIAGMITDRQEVTEVNKDTNQFSLDRLSRIKLDDKDNNNNIGADSNNNSTIDNNKSTIDNAGKQ